MRDEVEAVSSGAVARGTCVMIIDDIIVFAGPIGRAPDDACGKTVLLNPSDFEALNSMLKSADIDVHKTDGQRWK